MMNEGYMVPDGESRAEITVRNSKFIAEAVPVSSDEQARKRIDMRREEYSGSTHVVYAFLTGNPGSEVSGMSDDGEPSGTAGAPVLDVIRGSGVFNVLVTVVRYFGGVKLGTGGLVRAYSTAAVKALDRLPLRRFVKEISFTLRVPYNLHDKVKVIISGAEGQIMAEEFSDIVLLKGKVPESELESCNDELKSISGGGLFI